MHLFDFHLRWQLHFAFERPIIDLHRQQLHRAPLRMRRLSRALALLGLPVAFVATAARAAWPDDKKEEPNLRVRGHLDPTSIAPGSEGQVVLELEIRKTVHVYPDKRLKVTAKTAQAVSIGAVDVRGPFKKWQNPNDPKEPPETVLMDRAEVRVPIKLEKDARLPQTIELAVRYSACDEDQCFSPTTEVVRVDLPAPVPPGLASREPGPQPSEASPTTTTSSSRLSSFANPSLTMGWSSAMRTRIVPFLTSRRFGRNS